MLGRFVGLILIYFIGTAPLLGQRVIAQLKPDPVGPNLNLNFGLNFSRDGSTSPNMVFAEVEGRARGFVSYPTVLDTSTGTPRITSNPGSVVAFNPSSSPDMLEDGTLRIKPEAVIPIGMIGPQPARPFQITLSPDGKILAVVNVFSDAISLIDVQTAALRTTFRFSGAQFGVGNNIVFAPGGTLEQGYTAYISSFRQNPQFVPIEGELFQFRIQPDLRIELANRIVVGIGPARIAISEDGARLAVLNTLSRTQGGRVLVPVYVSLIDTASFRVQADLRPGSGDAFIFAAATTPVMLTLPDAESRPRKILLVATQGSPRVLVFDADSGSFLASMAVDVGPTVITPAPLSSGTVKTVMVTHAVVFPFPGSLSRLDIDGAKIYSDDPSTRQDALRLQPFSATGSLAPTSNVVFPFDQMRPFVAVYSLDRVISFDMSNGAIDTSTLVGDIQDRVSDLPFTVAITRDRQTLGVLNFAGNTIDLVVNGFHLDYPYLLSSDRLFTRLNVVNAGAQPAVANYTYITDSGVSQVVRPLPTAPLLSLPLNGQFGQTMDVLFELGRDSERSGWVDFSTSSKDLLGSFLVGNNFTGSMDGALPVYRHISRNYTQLVFPEVYVEGTDTLIQINLVNPTFTQATATLQLYKYTGERVGAQPINLTIPARSKISRFLNALYSEGLDDFTEGYITVNSNIGLIGFNLTLYPLSDGRYSLVGLNPVPILGGSNPPLLYAPLVTLGDGFDTMINLINVAPAPTDETTPPINADIRLTLYNSQGMVLGAIQRLLAPQTQLRQGLLSLLGLGDLRLVTGWVKIEISGLNPPVIGNAVLLGPNRDYAAAVPLQAQDLLRACESKSPCFSFVELLNNSPMDDTYVPENLVTGLAFTNIETSPATVSFEVFDANGQPVPGTQRPPLVVPPLQQVSRFPDELFTGPVVVAGGSIRIRSDRRLLATQSVLAVALGNRDYFLCLPPQAPPE